MDHTRIVPLFCDQQVESSRRLPCQDFGFTDTLFLAIHHDGIVRGSREKKLSHGLPITIGSSGINDQIVAVCVELKRKLVTVNVSGVKGTGSHRQKSFVFKLSFSSPTAPKQCHTRLRPVNTILFRQSAQLPHTLAVEVNLARIGQPAWHVLRVRQNRRRLTRIAKRRQLPVRLEKICTARQHFLETIDECLGELYPVSLTELVRIEKLIKDIEVVIG